MDYKKFPKASGVYKITNTVNGKVYVGLSVNLRDRCRGHIKDLRKGTHKNEHLQKSWDLYGEISFEFEVLQICTVETLSNNEDYWCKLLKSHDKRFGYNIQGTGEELYKWSNESKEKMGIKVIDLKSGTIYNSITEVSELTGILQQTLGKMLSGKRKNITQFKYYEKQVVIKGPDNRNRKVTNIKTGETFNSVKELASRLKMNHSTICRKLNGLRNNNTDYKYV